MCSPLILCNELSTPNTHISTNGKCVHMRAVDIVKDAARPRCRSRLKALSGAVKNLLC